MSDKGTLTILSNGQALLGLPNDHITYRDAEIAKFTATVQEWLEHGGTMHLPFPVEVTDLRQSQNVVVNNAIDKETGDKIVTGFAQGFLEPFEKSTK